jgi:hypothetical protein
MIETKIEIDKPFLSLQYDISQNKLYGDHEFKVTLIDVGSEPDETKAVSLINDDPNFIVDPTEFNIEFDTPQNIAIRLAEGASIEEGSYNLSFKINSEFAKETTLNASLVSSISVVSKNSNEYKLKYFIERPGYRLNIYQFVDSGVVLIPIEINGTVDISYQDKTDLYEPIIASTLKMRLEASLDLDLQDLYSEDEKTFKVELVKDSETKFLGFILPDGIWSDFVSDRWFLDITASDGLSTLKNIAFSNENGENFFGRMTAMNIISICLSKTGLNLPIISNCEIMYINMFPTTFYSVFYNINLSVERYFQNEKEPMDCENILKSIMQVFNCTVHQRKGCWYIYRAVDLKSQMIFFKNSYGFILEPVYVNLGKTLGSQINDFEIFHCSENQKISIGASVQAYQVSYEYGESKNILANGGLILEGTTGFNIPGWMVHNTGDGSVGRGVVNGYSYGIRHAVRPFNPQYPLLLNLNQSIDVKANSVIKLRIKFRNTGINSLYLNFKWGVQGSSSTVWYKIDEGFGQNTDIQAVRNAIPYGNLGNNVFQGAGDAYFEAEAMTPIDGNIIIEIFKETGGQQGGLFGVYSIDCSASGTGNIKSKDYTGRRTGRTSTNVKSNVTVYNGDSGSDLFVGTIYKADADTPTDKWSRYYFDNIGNIVSFNESLEVLEINAEDNLRISPRPMYIFEGDFKGYMEYMEVVSIDGLTNKKFQFIKYSYSFDNDITKCVLKEF